MYTYTANKEVMIHNPYIYVCIYHSMYFYFLLCK